MEFRRIESPEGALSASDGWQPIDKDDPRIQALKGRYLLNTI